MNTPPINYRSLKRNELVPTTGSVKVHAVRETLSTSATANGFTLQPSFVVSGDLAEKGVSYPVEWKVRLAPGDLDKLANALNNLEDDLRQRNFTTFAPLEFEGYIQVTDAIRIGYLATKGADKVTVIYYADFSQGEHRLRSEFKTLEELRAVHRLQL